MEKIARKKKMERLDARNVFLTHILYFKKKEFPGLL